jgi:hypothetical protein
LNIDQIFKMYSNNPIPAELYLPHRELMDRLYQLKKNGLV